MGAILYMAHQVGFFFILFSGVAGLFIPTCSGIGKSYFGLYILWRLRLCCGTDTSVVWYAANERLIFHPDGRVSHCSFDPVEYIYNPSNWLLIDAHPPPQAVARTILLTSPQRERFKEFSRTDNVRMVCMPLWDMQELLDLHKSEFTQLARARVLELCTLWGPVPRSVLTHASNMIFQEQQEALITALPEQSFNEFIKRMGDTTYPYGLISGTVIHMHPNESYTFSRPRFASDRIANRFIDNLILK